MKAMILAAGLGMRLRPLTLEKPKPMVELAGKPLLFYHLEKLTKAGFQEVIINHSWLGEKIVEAVADGACWGLKITYSKEEQPLETGGGIFQALKHLGDDPFLVVNGDIFTDYSFEALSPDIAGDAHLILVDTPDFKLAGDFGLTQDNYLLDENNHNSLTYSGISVLKPSLFHRCQPGKFGLTPLLREAIRCGKASGEHYQGHWTDVGTHERLKHLETYLHQSRK